MNRTRNIPETVQLPVIPLRGLVVFPGHLIHFDLGRKRSIQSLNEAMETHDQTVFLVTQKKLDEEEPAQDGLYAVGVVARIRQVLKLPGDNLRILVEGICRARMLTLFSEETFLLAAVQPYPVMQTSITKREEAMIRQCREAFDRYTEFGQSLSAEVGIEIATAVSAGSIADHIAFHLPLPLENKQAILSTLPISRRVELLLTVLAKETEILELEQKLRNKVQQQMDQNQRDYYLHEQMKAISEELGEGDDPLEEAEAYRRKIRELKLDEAVSRKFGEECDKLAKMPLGSHEAAVVRGYLDTCLALPWQTYTKDKHDLALARKILDRDHYGLSKVKERMLEMLAVRALNPDIKGQIICLSGPPGVGKTSVVRSVAEAMGRKYVRISLGGVKDESDIRGHRKTYIGSMPGRIIAAIKTAGTANPLILLDEIDKMSHDFRGDPASAMLEVLDPEQNVTFEDHFLEVPFDLSQVLFITTANDPEAIPAPLRDRMEMIELPSYTAQEKFEIAKRHLLKKQRERHGLTSRQLKISDAVLRELIDGYTREAGVRNLEREIARLCRKAAAAIVAGETDALKVADLQALLGPRRYKPETRAKKDEIGVANGLAWTAAGGEMLPIEVAVLEGTGKIELTGSLGDVMKESARIAVSYVRSQAAALGIAPDFYKMTDIHIHAPEGAVPKDGPSAGVTMTTALVSALTGIPVKQTVAMTGEISLRGHVLPIGGLREKTMAAYTHQMKTVLIPSDNEADLADVEPIVKQHLTFVPVRQLSTVLTEALVQNPYREREAAGKEDTLPAKKREMPPVTVPTCVPPCARS